MDNMADNYMWLIIKRIMDNMANNYNNG